MDELSTLGPSYLGIVKGATVREDVLHYSSVGITRGVPGEIFQKETHVENAMTLLGAISNTGCSSAKDIVCLNAASLLLLAGNVRSMKEGVEVARDFVESGAALDLLRRYVLWTGGNPATIDSLLASHGFGRAKMRLGVRQNFGTLDGVRMVHGVSLPEP